ncbi:MAG: primosomal protein N' [Planctomycetota bacterium]
MHNTPAIAGAFALDRARAAGRHSEGRDCPILVVSACRPDATRSGTKVVMAVERNLFGEPIRQPRPTAPRRLEVEPDDDAAPGDESDYRSASDWNEGEHSIARIALPLPPPTEPVYDYLVPEPLRHRVQAGCRAKARFGHRLMEGIVVEVADRPRDGVDRVRPLHSLPDDTPLFDAHMLGLTEWMADYYCAGWGEVLAAAVPAGVRRGNRKRTRVELRLTGTPEAASALADELEQSEQTRKQARVLRTLLAFHDEAFTPAGLAQRLGIGISPIRTLARRGAVRYEQVPDDVRPEDAFGEADGKPDAALTDEQQTAIAALEAAVAARRFKPFLLQGVTGSGKTEVYIHAIERTLAQGRGAIVLVPEIALTPQTQRRFQARFDRVAMFHSALTDRERMGEWKAVRNGDARVAIGARSALFAPVQDLGLIVVDEEHEGSYKQSNAPRYHARDVAVQRAYMSQAVVILGSATPSMESRLNAEAGKYGHLQLTRRVADRPLPDVKLIDMGHECAEQHRYAILSRRLEDELHICVEQRDEQAIVFLNRRGYQTYIHCATCGHVLTCSNCDISMTYHRHLEKAVCHYCFETRTPPKLCPECRRGEMKYSGYGTQQIEETVRARFPAYRIARMDSDTMTRRHDYEDTLRQFRDGELDVLIGTQMIAKGLDFPNVTLVGVISADGALSMPDFRARERTFQLVAQVAGRAGRGHKPGLVIVQTYHPDEPAVKLAAAQDYEAFFRREIRDRQSVKYPPFSRLMAITAESESADKAEGTVREWAAALRNTDVSRDGKARQLGPAPAAIALLRGRWRWQLMIKADNVVTVRALTAVARKLPHPRGVRVTVDVDPVDMM